MIQVVRGPVTDQTVDAIVNAANTRMRGGGGIDGRIHQLAGPKMLQELCRVAPQGARVGEPVVTPGFDLPHRYVLHVAGPIWHGGGSGEAEALARCYRSTLEAAVRLGCGSIGYCSISTGAFGYPLEHAAPLAVETLHAALFDLDPIDVVLAMYGLDEYEAFSAAVAQFDL